LGALVVFDQLVVGEAALVEFGALLAQLGFGSLPGGLLLGDSGSPLGQVGALLELLRGLSVLGRGALSAFAELLLTTA
jgi:hypothetical protein